MHALCGPVGETQRSMQPKSVKLLYAVDLAGTLLFAIEGASAAIAGRLDLLGVMVLAFATALGGGIIRDVLIGSVPPNALRDWRYSATAFIGASLHVFLKRFCASHSLAGHHSS
jgi:uncharacterized membrane protein YeiH